MGQHRFNRHRLQRLGLAGIAAIAAAAIAVAGSGVAQSATIYPAHTAGTINDPHGIPHLSASPTGDSTIRFYTQSGFNPSYVRVENAAGQVGRYPILLKPSGVRWTHRIRQSPGQYLKCFMVNGKPVLPDGAGAPQLKTCAFALFASNQGNLLRLRLVGTCRTKWFGIGALLRRVHYPIHALPWG